MLYLVPEKSDNSDKNKMIEESIIKHFAVFTF